MKIAAEDVVQTTRRPLRGNRELRTRTKKDSYVFESAVAKIRRLQVHHRSFLPNRRNRYLNYFSSSRSNTNELCSRTRLARERSIVSRVPLKRKRREINRNSRRIAADIVSFDSTAPLTRAGRLVSPRERPKPVKSVECNPCGVRDVKADVQASTVFH